MTGSAEPEQYRAELDFEITFANGGALRGEGFRIDVSGPELTEPELGAALIRDLGLLMADGIRILRCQMLVERHKRDRPAGQASVAAGPLQRADLSHIIEDGMVTLPNLPPPRVSPVSISDRVPSDRYAPGVTFAIGEISLCGNTGTYVDSPFHRYAGTADLADVPLDRLADLDGIVVDLTGSRRTAIGAELLVPYDVSGKAVLIRTGWDVRWRTDGYADGHPFLTEDAASHLAAAGAVLVGTDAANIDSPADPARPAHSVLLAAGIPVCEHLTGLAALPGAGFRFTAAPAPVRGFGTFPVRAFASWPAGSDGG